jgi:hypothetical protein
MDAMMRERGQLTDIPQILAVRIQRILLKEMVRPGGFELPTFWFVAVRSTLPNLARGVANRTKSASWGKFSQTTFSFICCRLPHFCRRFLQFALHFRDRPTHLGASQERPTDSCINLTSPRIVSGFAVCCQIFLSLASQPVSNLTQCRLFTFRKQQSTLDLTSQDPVLCPKIFVPQQEFLIDRSGDVGHHPKHFGFPLDLHPGESEIVDAVFQSEKPIRGELVESCKLRYFNSFEFFDHTRSGSSPSPSPAYPLRMNRLGASSSSRSPGSTLPRVPLLASGTSTNAASARQSAC